MNLQKPELDKLQKEIERARIACGLPGDLDEIRGRGFTVSYASAENLGFITQVSGTITSPTATQWNANEPFEITLRTDLRMFQGKICDVIEISFSQGQAWLVCHYRTPGYDHVTQKPYQVSFELR